MWHVPFHLFADYDNTVNVRALCLVNVAVVSVFISYLIYYLPYCPPTHFNFIYNPFLISILSHISRLYGPCPVPPPSSHSFFPPLRLCNASSSSESSPSHFIRIMPVLSVTSHQCLFLHMVISSTSYLEGSYFPRQSPQSYSYFPVTHSHVNCFYIIITILC